MQLSLLLPTCGAANPTPPMHLIETKFRSLKHELLKKLKKILLVLKEMLQDAKINNLALCCIQSYCNGYNLF